MSFDFNKLFKFTSYSLIFCGFVSLIITGIFSFLATFIYLLIIIGSWFFEKKGVQLSKRLGNIAAVFIILIFLTLWKFSYFLPIENKSFSSLFFVHLLVILSIIKLVQLKSTRDWMFLYFLSFIELLIAAGISISPTYLISFFLFWNVALCTAVIFEVKKTSEFNKKVKSQSEVESSFLIQGTSAGASITKFPQITLWLLLLILIFALPTFYLLPRLGNSGGGVEAKTLSGFSGFSDFVNLGAVGSLKEDDRIVMRIKLDSPKDSGSGNLRWRGVALDYFDNKNWSKSKKVSSESINRVDKDYFLLNRLTNKDNLTVQTIYLEPINSTTLFSLANPVIVQANFQTLIKDSEDSLKISRPDSQRIIYKVYSNQDLPDKTVLQSDNEGYTFKDSHYLELPDNTDKRIAQLTKEITNTKQNRYDRAKAVEEYLQNNFGYTLELKASGEQPLADFLFNIRAGHCEYFATAMAVMLRTQGIATRVVNGFQEGDYNATANVYVVRQKNAHSWVEVYFPEQNVWIQFDPTPFAGQNDGTVSQGVFEKFNDYAEALETFYIQYFVSYDDQEQRSLLRTAKNSFSYYQIILSEQVNNIGAKISDWWKNVRGDYGLLKSLTAVGYSFLYCCFLALTGLLLFLFYKRIVKLSVWKRFFLRKNKNAGNIIEFYEKMQNVLKQKGFIRQPHQTPLEFAFELNMPEAVYLTEKYNGVRFGEKQMSGSESKQINNWLARLENNGAV